MSPTISQIIQKAKKFIDQREAELLLAYALDNIPREKIIAYGNKPLSFFIKSPIKRTLARLRFYSFLTQRKGNVPIAYLLKQKYFYGRAFFVNRHVLVPRPETEQIVELVLKKLQSIKNATLVDIGTGSGCIPISIISELKKQKKIHLKKILAVDISKKSISRCKKKCQDI